MLRIISIFTLVLTIVACDKPSPNTIVVGTIAGPESDLVVVAKEVAEKNDGLTVKIIEFNDYNLPNEALQDGSLDVNVYQHLPYLQSTIKAHGYKLEPIGKTFIYPMGIYSQQYKSLNDIPDHSLIAIPNDPSNETRALLLLEKAHLITLKQATDAHGVPEVESNPKGLQLKEMDAAQLPRALPDVAAAVINTTFALPAGLSPTKDALFSEDKDSPYANLIVVKQDNPKKEQLELFVKALNSLPVKAKAKELFGDSALPAW